ncbi:hypothetical protein [Actinotalea sp. JY-7885]|uniref:hypothetical protein n=1 Tax=Actinotalea sp. JY-7885 TaxID=2758576 RepID=UPI00165E993A|nr:hypothetical protein [Actinotalea sp. JY-7885]
MSDYLIGVDGDYRFSFDTVAADALAAWDDADWFESTSTLQRQAADGQLLLDVGFLGDGEGFGLRGTRESVAEFAAWLTTRAGFPEDGSVILAGWAEDVLTLSPDTAVADLLAQ